MFLIIENNDSICQYFPSEAKFLNVTNMSLTETLEKLKDYQDVTHIYFPIELKFKGTYRQALQGLEFFKHIRLTPEFREEIQYAPILLGYTYPLEAILRNSESTILCSPATHLFNLKNINQVNSSKFLQSEEKLTKDILKPYILYTDTDEAKSEHDRRNEQGPLKLERELNGASRSDISLDLWQKKILFLQTETKANEHANVSDDDFKATIKGKRILYLDDEADKWEKPLRKLFEGAEFEIKKDFSDIYALLKSLNEQGENIIDEFKQKEAEIYKLRPQIDAAQALLNSSEKIENNANNETGVGVVTEKIKQNIEVVKRNIQNYTASLDILSDKQHLFDVNRFHKSNTALLKVMRHISTNISMLFAAQQMVQNAGKEDGNEQPVTAEFLSTIKNFHSEFVSGLNKILDYDLIILDLRLIPKADTHSEITSGIEVLKFLKSFNPYIPILLFTASQNIKNRDIAIELNKGGAYWIKNVSHANDLKRDILKILVDHVVHEIYWKTKLILNKGFIEKYLVSNNGTSINREQLNSKDLEVIKKSLKYFVEFHFERTPSINDFWANTFKLNEARFTADKLGQMDRPQLIALLNLDNIEHQFNKKRINVAAHIEKQNDSANQQIDEYELCKKYIEYSIDWFLNYLPTKG